MTPKGLYHKYNVTKADGSPVDPDAFYLVLRLDSGEYQEACLAAAIEFARELQDKNPQLRRDLLEVVERYINK